MDKDNSDGTTMKVFTAIVETNVFGALAYHARCMMCGWKSKRFDHQQQAVKAGHLHAVKHIDKDTTGGAQ